MLFTSGQNFRSTGETLETFRHIPRGLRSPQAIREILRGCGDHRHSYLARIACFRDARRLISVVVFFSLRPISFQRYAQAIGNPIHVSVIGDDLRDVQDRAVAEAAGAQLPQIVLGHIPRRSRQLGDVIQHLPIGRCQNGAAVI